MPDINDSMQSAGAMADALQDVLRQLIDKIVGGPSKGKGGEPLRDVCYMILPMGEPIDPRDFSFAWDPAGGDSSADVQDDGKFGTAAAAAAVAASAPAAGSPQPAPAPVTDKKLQHSLSSARNISTRFNQMMRVTDDGSYRPFTSAGTISSSYEAIITKAQGIPAPPLPADIQKQVDEAMHVLYVFDDAGKQKGKTKEFKNYQMLKQTYADAEAEYANAQAAAMTNAALGQVWPVTSKSLRTKVENAYDDWRSADAENIENALETVKSIGGSIGNHFLAQARALYDAWNLGLAGAVAVGVPYTQIMPGSWYDPNDKQNGFTGITASNSHYQSFSQSHSAQAASSWYQGHSSSKGGSAGGMIFGVTFGGASSHTSTNEQSGSSGSFNQGSSFSNSMSNVTISLEFGLCTIYRPWLLRELFVIDGWYLPGEKENVISDGTIGGQKGEDDAHLLPMIPTQFLVVRNVSITADGWGAAGSQMSEYCRQATAESQSSSSTMAGGAGFLCFGGTVSRSSADWSGDDAESSAAAGSCFFEGDANHGTLTIHGGQIVGWIGEILPASPKHDGTKETDEATKAAATGEQPAAAPAPGQPAAAAPTPASH
jgi:hypothetical protein